MGTTKSSETLAMAEFLRSQRTTTQADQDSRVEGHEGKVRYVTAGTELHPAAH